MNYSGIINCSIVDGIGFRTTLFISGCKHCCEGCHNPQAWDFNAGKKYTKEELAKEPEIDKINAEIEEKECELLELMEEWEELDAQQSEMN